MNSCKSYKKGGVCFYGFCGTFSVVCFFFTWHLVNREKSYLFADLSFARLMISRFFGIGTKRPAFFSLLIHSSSISS